jgi:predicted CoA-binding protein
MNHELEYPAGYLLEILREVKTIAMVGASSRPTRSSHGVLRVLDEAGCDMIPVNPREASAEIHGLYCHDSLAAIERPVDMVDIFRSSKAAYAVTEQAIEIGAKVVWMQIGVRNDDAARLAESAGLRVVMNRVQRSNCCVRSRSRAATRSTDGR